MDTFIFKESNVTLITDISEIIEQFGRIFEKIH